MTFFYGLLDMASEQSEAIAKVVFVGRVEVGDDTIIIIIILLLSPDFLNNFLPIHTK